MIDRQLQQGTCVGVCRGGGSVHDEGVTSPRGGGDTSVRGDQRGRLALGGGGDRHRVTTAAA